MARKIQIKEGKFQIKEQIEIIYEKKITPFGNAAKIGAPKKYIGSRAYIVIVKD